MYDTAPGLSGNQSWTGTLGLNFSVAGSVSVGSLGVFDSNGDGLSGTLYSTIFDMMGNAVTPTVSFSGTAGSGNPYLYQSIGPVTLAAGNYQLASWGYSGADQNYNNYGAGGPITFNSVGGSLTALGTSYSGSAGGLATIADIGATRYGAGQLYRFDGHAAAAATPAGSGRSGRLRCCGGSRRQPELGGHARSRFHRDARDQDQRARRVRQRQRRHSRHAHTPSSTIRSAMR